MLKRIRKVGNSKVITINNSIISLLNFGDTVNITTDGKRLIIEAVEETAGLDELRKECEEINV